MQTTHSGPNLNIIRWDRHPGDKLLLPHAMMASSILCLTPPPLLSNTSLGAKVCGSRSMCWSSVLNQISMRNGGSGLEGAARQAGSFICLFFISRPQSTGTDSPHSSWDQNNVRWYIVSSAELTQGEGNKSSWWIAGKGRMDSWEKRNGGDRWTMKMREGHR